MIVKMYNVTLPMKKIIDLLVIKREAISSEVLSFVSLLVCRTVSVLPTIISIRAEVWYLQSNFSPRKQIAMSVLEMIPVAELHENKTISANGRTTSGKELHQKKNLHAWIVQLTVTMQNARNHKPVQKPLFEIDPSASS